MAPTAVNEEMEAQGEAEAAADVSAPPAAEEAVAANPDHELANHLHGPPPNRADRPVRGPVDRREILRALEVVERDSTAIAESFASLFSSLRLALSEATSISVENLQCFGDVVGRLQESALDAATKGNRYINSCLRLNEEMKGMESLAMQLKTLRKNVDTLDMAVNRLLHLP